MTQQCFVSSLVRGTARVRHGGLGACGLAFVTLFVFSCGDDAPKRPVKDGGGVLGGGPPGRPRPAGDGGDQVMPVADAGASSGLDAGSSVPDTGVPGSPVDAGSSTQADGGPSDEVFYSKLRTCGLLTAGRTSAVGAPASPLEECVRPCLLNATCQELSIYLCGGELSGSFKTCATACVPKCEGGTTSGDSPEYCDGIAECKDGSDEAGCERYYFVCKNGKKTSRGYQCDDTDDCGDGSDEVGCAAPVSCGPGEATVPALFVCDQEPDCTNGSDENGCAEYICQ